MRLRIKRKSIVYPDIAFNMGLSNYHTSIVLVHIALVRILTHKTILLFNHSFPDAVDLHSTQFTSMKLAKFPHKEMPFRSTNITDGIIADGHRRVARQGVGKCPWRDARNRHVNEERPSSAEPHQAAFVVDKYARTPHQLIYLLDFRDDARSWFTERTHCR